MTRAGRVTALTALAVLGVASLVSCGSDGQAAPPAAAAEHDPAEHAADASSPTTSPPGDTIDPVAFNQDMRKLWVDHVTWTRLYLVSAIAGLPDLDATAGRLLQNQDDIGDAMATFYGAEAGEALSALLREHILVAADLVTAAKAGDADAVALEHARWYANADEIARFLAAANPAWPEATLQQMMRGHLDQTLAEATARLEGDWAADIAEYDRIEVHILAMADALADGIVAQFPGRFAA